MQPTANSKSREIRSRLNHPIIDADGHQVEFVAPLEDYVKEIGGNEYSVEFVRTLRRAADRDSYRKDARPAVSQYDGNVWWVFPTKNTLDRATAALPRLLYERMDDIGLDFAILLNTVQGVVVKRKGASLPGIDNEAERVMLRAMNAYRADICQEYSDRMTPVAEISMQTPQSAIEDLEHAITELGMKAIQISMPHRPIPAIHRKHPDLFPDIYWLDNLALDSDYDYDPFWDACITLKVPILDHAGGIGFTGRNTPNNYMYNHMGHFADAGEALCKALLLGGVTRRFPGLKVAFLEGGVAWACRLYNDLIGHWEKRNRDSVHNYNPANLDKALLRDLYSQYGDEIIRNKLDKLFDVGAATDPEVTDDPEIFDDFSRCHIQKPEDIRDLFVPNFFFGCESDDPTNSLAFNEKLLPFGAKLKAIFSSDIGHWDVPDMTGVLEEAYESVEREILTPQQFKEFTFDNAVGLFAGMNPSFFDNTVIENEVKDLMSPGD